MIRRALPHHFHHIALIHQDKLKAGLLASLGTEFLTEFYRRASKDAVLLVDADPVVGFVLGVKDTKRFYRSFLLKNGLWLGWELIKSIRTVGRALSLGKYVSASPKDLPSGELLSIAVTQRGAGTRLFRAFAKEVPDFRVTAANTQTEALRFYVKMGGSVQSTTDLGGLTSHTFVFGKTSEEVEYLKRVAYLLSVRELDSWQEQAARCYRELGKSPRTAAVEIGSRR